MDAELIQLRWDHQTSGFSLVELMLVVAILSVLSVMAGLSVTRFAVNPPGDRQQFLTLDKALRKDALMTRRIQELRATDRGFARVTHQDGTPELSAVEQLWNISPDWVTPLGPESRIYYLPDGRSTPLVIDFREGPGIIRCISDGWAGPKCQDR